MRSSIASAALCGAVTVSALALPEAIQKRLTLVDLLPFGSFPTISPEKAKADAEALRQKIEDGIDDLFGLDDVKTAQTEGSGDQVNALAGEGNTTTTAGTCNTADPPIRYEWRNYQQSDRLAFVSAIKCLMDAPSGDPEAFPGSQSRYEDLVSVHQQMTSSIHMLAQFLPWHRYYVSVLESLMREECGFTPAFPWWDETMDSGAFADSDIFTDQYFGPLPAKTSDGQGTCIDSGTFGGTTLHIGPGSGFTDHCLSRAVDESLTAEVNQDFVNNCNSNPTYDDMRSCQEMGPHAYGHNSIGAVMAEVSASPGDPIFFMHHLFVDHTFRIWQLADPARLTTINGCSDGNSPCTQIGMDYVLSSRGLRPDTTVGDVMNTQGGYLCYRYDY